MCSVGVCFFVQDFGIVLTLKTAIAVGYSRFLLSQRDSRQHLSVGTRNRTTLYICGTDEYGTATERQAVKENRSEEALCLEYHKIHKETYEWFDIGYAPHISLASKQLTIVNSDLTSLGVLPPLCIRSNAGADYFDLSLLHLQNMPRNLHELGEERSFR